jgi:hypothetical protein
MPGGWSRQSYSYFFMVTMAFEKEIGKILTKVSTSRPDIAAGHALD